MPMPIALTTTIAIDAVRLHVIDFVMIGLYLLGVLGLGTWFVRRERTSVDYFRSSGRVPWWAAGLSLYGTGLSAITFIAIPAVAYRTNWAYFVGMIAGVAAVPFVAVWFIPLYRKLDITTAYEYLDKRFSLPVRMFAAVVFITFHLGRTAIVLVLPALVLSEAVGINMYLSIAIIGGVSIVYTMLGGIEAVVWTDVAQVVVLIGGAATATVISIMSLDGGCGEFVSVAQSHDKFALWNEGFSPYQLSLWVIILGYGISQFNAYVSDQSLVQRYLTTRNTRGAIKALWLSAAGGVPIQLLFYAVGTAMFVYYKAHPASLPDVNMADALVSVFLIEQLPIGLTGIVIAGVFAAGMSTIDSSMNSIATAVVSDFAVPMRGKAAAAGSNHWQVPLARVVTVVVGLIGTCAAMAVAASGSKDLLNLFLGWLFLVMGVLAGLFVLGACTVRSHSLGVLLGAAMAAAVVVRLKVTSELSGFLFSGIGLGVCVIVGYVASVLLPSARSDRDLAGLTIHTRR